jgi:hypothetical protein
MTFYPSTKDEVVTWLRTRTSAFNVEGVTNGGGDTLSLQHLNKVVDYQPEETLITVEAGIEVAELNHLLAEHGQWVPTLLDRKETRLVEALLLNRYHPRSLTSSPLATSVLGGYFVTNRGVLFRSGSRVVKSVAGYDTHRAFVGSRGLFGLPLEVNLKVLPRPETFVRFTSEAAHRGKLAQYNPTVLEEVEGQLVVELAGFRDDVETDHDQLKAAGLVNQEITDNWADVLAACDHRVPSSVESERLMHTLAKALNSLRAE